MSPVRLIRDALAVKRITRLVVDDEIFAELRDYVLDRWPPAEHKLSYLISCPKCVSVWAGFAVASGVLPRFLVEALAASEATILVEERFSRWD